MSRRSKPEAPEALALNFPLETRDRQGAEDRGKPKQSNTYGTQA